MHITPPPVSPTTIFVEIGDYFKDLSDEFYTLYDEIYGVWLLGPYLAWPFWAVGYFFESIYNLCYIFNNAYSFVEGAIDDLFGGTSFRDLLDWLSEQYRLIREDPVGWVDDRFGDISHSMWSLVHNTWLWFQEQYDDITPWFFDWRMWPDITIENFLIGLHSFLDYFLYNPLAYIVDQVYAGIWFMIDLRDQATWRVIQWIADGYNWFWDFIWDRIGFVVDTWKSYRWDLEQFIDNPFDWAFDKAMEVTGWNYDDFADIFYTVFDGILDSAVSYVQRQLSKVESTTCDIVMLFM